MKVMVVLPFQYRKIATNFHFSFVSSQTWDVNFVQKLSLYLLERCFHSLTSEDHLSAQLIDACRLPQGLFRLLGVVEYLPGGLSGSLDPIEGSASFLGHDS